MGLRDELRRRLEHARGELERKAKAISRDQRLMEWVGEAWAAAMRGERRPSFGKEQPRAWREAPCYYCLRPVTWSRNGAGEVTTCCAACRRRTWALLFNAVDAARTHGVVLSATVHELANLRAAALDPAPTEWSRTAPERGNKRTVAGEPAVLRGSCPYCGEPYTLQSVTLVAALAHSGGGPMAPVNKMAVCKSCHGSRRELFPGDCDVLPDIAAAVVAWMAARNDVDPDHLASAQAWAERQARLTADWEEAGSGADWLTYVRWRVEQGDLNG